MNRVLLAVGTAVAIALGATTAASAVTASSVAGVQIAAPYSSPIGVNDRGDVIGNYSTNTGFFWHAGKLTNLGFLPGAAYAYASAINASGAVAGYSGASSSTGSWSHAYVWRDGKMTALPDLGSSGFADAINDGGTVAGTVYDASGNVLAAEWKDGKLTTLPGLGGSFSEAAKISDTGLVVGQSADASASDHAVVWENGKVVDLGLGNPVAVNDRGQVLVNATPASGPWYAFIWDHGKETVLPAGTNAVGLNNEGQVVGYVQLSGTSTSDGFLWRSGTLTDLGLEQPTAINDRGQVVEYLYDNGVFDYQVRNADGSTIKLVPTTGTSASATLINDKGLVAGYTEDTVAATVWQLPNH
jgi:probable HAF family extracellular repeat protein/YD repeat-containing protein